MSKTQMIQVSNQELYVFGKLISRHPDFPWLFSITDVYKACEKPIKGEAKKYGRNPEVTFTAKRPGEWMKRNTYKERIDAVAHEVRRRIKKYGSSCGFARTESDATKVASLSNKDICVKVVKGNFKSGLTQGTYVAQDFIVGYAGFLNEKLHARIHSTFISVLNGYTDEVTKKVEKNERIAKGTQTRRENKQLNDELVEACGFKKLLPMKVQEGINEGVLGLPAMKYKKLHGIKEPFNDNLTEEQVCMKNIGIALSTLRIRRHEKEELTHKEGKHIGLTSGQYARRITLEAVQA